MRKLTFLFTFLLFVAFQASAQMQISGKVTNAETGEPIPGASIFVKSQSTIGTTSDMDGNYVLKGVPSDATTLVVSFVGMEEKEVAINGRSTINVALEEKAMEMDEVVVVGYGVTKKASFTGAASSVKTEKLEAKPVATVDQALQGNVSGLQVASGSGQPGSSNTLRIRGMGSFSAGNEPLVVVDGIPIESGDIARANPSASALSSLNPDDIASVNVLKDAAATSIYGSRASNGVILITTKSGSKGETKFNFETQLGFSERLKGNYEALNAEEWKELKYEGLVNSGVNPTAAYNQIAQYGDTDADWIDAAFRRGSTQKYSLSARGGNEKTKFYASGQYYEEEGVVIASSIERYVGRLNVDHQATDKMNLGVNVSGSYVNNPGRSGGGNYNDPVTGSYFIPPVMPIYNDDGTYNKNIPLYNNYNLIQEAEYNIDGFENHRVFGNAYFDYEIVEDLIWKTKAGVDYIEIKEVDFLHPETEDGKSYNGLGQEFYTTRENYVLTNTLNYTKTFNESHNINVLLGQEAQDYRRSEADLEAQNYPTGKLVTLANAAEKINASTVRTAHSLASYFGRFKYNFQEKYYLSVSFRRDGSSRFGSENKWANFYSVGASWRLTQEGFMAGQDIFDDLKLRGSYGTSGNQSGIGNFAAAGLYGFGQDYNSQPGSAPTQIANPELRWEAAKNMNIGIDMRVFDFLSFSASYYDNRTSDLLLNVPISSTTGFLTQLRNIGEMRNTGIELEANAEIFKRGDFKWFVDGNLSFNRNEVVKLNQGEDIVEYPHIHSEGDPFYTFYSPKWAGVNPANGMPLWYDEDGNIVDNYGDADFQRTGSAHPDYYGGLTNRLQYKGFTFSFFFNFQVGNDVYVNHYRYVNSDGAYSSFNQTRQALERWQEPGDFTEVPKRIEGNSTSSRDFSSRYIEDASYLRLKNVTLSYDLPKSLVSKAKLNSTRIFVQGTNLLTFTNYSGFDPEKQADGEVWFSYPNTMNVTAGVKIGF